MRLSAAPILQLPNPAEPFTIATDASNTGVGAVLLQTVGGKELPVAYYSKKLTSTERNYSTIDRELLAVVSAVKRWRPYVFANKTVVRTDHQPLVDLRLQPTLSSR